MVPMRTRTPAYNDIHQQKSVHNAETIAAVNLAANYAKACPKVDAYWAGDSISGFG